MTLRYYISEARVMTEDTDTSSSSLAAPPRNCLPHRRMCATRVVVYSSREYARWWRIPHRTRKRLPPDRHLHTERTCVGVGAIETTDRLTVNLSLSIRRRAGGPFPQEVNGNRIARDYEQRCRCLSTVQNLNFRDKEPYL